PPGSPGSVRVDLPRGSLSVSPSLQRPPTPGVRPSCTGVGPSVWAGADHAATGQFASARMGSHPDRGSETMAAAPGSHLPQVCVSVTSGQGATAGKTMTDRA